MSDINEGRAKLLVQAADFGLHVLTQFLVERTQRLIEQDHRRPVRETTCQRDALLLPAGKLLRITFRVVIHVHHGERIVHRPLDVVARMATHAQAIRDVVPYVHVRKQRVTLKHHADATFARLHMRDVAAVDLDAPGCRRNQSGNHLQQGCLAGAGRSEQREKFAGLHGEIGRLQS